MRLFGRKQPRAMNRFYRVDKVRLPGEPRRRLVQDYYHQSEISWRGKIYKILIIVAIILVGQSFFQLPLFTLDKIEISGLKYVPPDEIRQRVETKLQERSWFIFKNSNYFLFNPGTLSNDLTAQYILKDLKVTKIFPHTLQISGQEKIAPFIRQTPEKFIVLNYSGQSSGEVTGSDDKHTVIADERSDRSSEIPLSYLEQATNLLLAWNINPNVLKITKFHLDDQLDQLTVSTDQGYKIYFSTKDSYAKQLNRLNEILSQNAIPSTIQYIDLRFENNIYFK